MADYSQTVGNILNLYGMAKVSRWGVMIWPGIAEELVGTKAWYVRDGYFKNVDACIFTHVSGDFASSYGDNRWFKRVGVSRRQIRGNYLRRDDEVLRH